LMGIPERIRQWRASGANKDQPKIVASAAT